MAGRPDPRDERRHPPGPEPLWNESYYFDFAADDGSVGGYVRIGFYPNLGTIWYWACVVGRDRDLVTVIDHEVPLPSSQQSLEIRTTGLWADHTCETPLEHFSLGLEAFGVGVDDPAEVYGRFHGDQVPIGFDLEWETDGEAFLYPPGLDRYEVPCFVHGEILLGAETIEFSGHGQRDHSWGVRDWWTPSWCWNAGWLDDGTRFHAVTLLTPGLDWSVGYVQPPGGVPEPIGGFSVDHAVGDEGIPKEIRLQLDDLAIDAEPLGWAPVLLVDPEGRQSRFPRGMIALADDRGRHGMGWIEFNQPPPPPTP
jgi:hypothetical protein